MRAAVSIDDVFMRAMEFSDPRERERYLDSVSFDGTDLRAQVEKLLAIAPQLGSFLEAPAATHWDADTKSDPDSLDLSGQFLGPYRLIRLAGNGGMGDVYLAEQQSPIQRQVAIKVIRSGLATAPLLARFAHESHLLGLMDHPNIARVLDAGATPGGSPFIAMEWVAGVHITTFCDQERYTIRQRVELLIAVCQAVQHAHQKGIIHRDLKPSNVLVTLKDGQAVPKVIDFGVARATQADLADQQRVTQTGQIVGTFEYMAPEQADSINTDVDTRADVFALGALLYELLTGASPIPQEDFRKAGFGERLRLIREVEPVRPSQRYAGLADVDSIAANRQTRVAHLTRLVANELDWICLKCLEKDRARRYETTNALAQDLLRYISGEPVQAGPPTLAYRFKKFAARNQKSFAVASVLGFLLVGAAIFSTCQAIRLGRLHEQSQANLKAANSNLNLAVSAVDQFCTKVSEDLRLKEQDLRPLRMELLSSAVEFQRQLVDLRNRSGAARIDLARAHAKLGGLTMEIDSPDQAIASYRLAIEEYRDLAAVDLAEQQSNHLEQENCNYELARCYYNLGLLLGRSREPAQGKLAAVESVAILEPLLQQQSGPMSYPTRTTLANVRILQSELAKDSQQFDESDAFLQMAIDEWEMLAKERPNDQETLCNLACSVSHRGAGLFQRSLSRWREAEVLLLKASKILRRGRDQQFATPQFDVRLAETLRTLGQICKSTGRSDEAISYMSEAIATLETVRLKESSVRSHVIQLGSIHTDLSMVYSLDGNPAAQRASLETAIELMAPLAGELDVELNLAVATGQLGRLLFKEEDLARSEILLDRAIGLAEKIHQRSRKDRHLLNIYPGMLEDRAKLRAKQGRLEEALRDYDSAVEAAPVAMRAPKRMARGRIRAQLGDHQQAMKDVHETLAELPSELPDHVLIPILENGARLCAECSTVVDSDENLSPDEKDVLVEEYAVKAVGLLEQAIRKGFKDIGSLATIPEFEPLREREDFKAIRRQR
jgi:serine/threonine protein kinase